MLKIKKERVLEAAETCSDVRKVLKTLFPEAFEDEYYKFENEHEVSTSPSVDKPVYIGSGHAPIGMEHKCLVVHREYESEIMEHDGRQVITFKKK